MTEPRRLAAPKMRVGHFASGGIVKQDSGVQKLLDGFQTGLDLLGIVDPTGLADLTNAGISGVRAVTEPDRRGEHLTNAGISLVSAVPFGDFAKAGKFRQFSRVAESAHEMARAKRVDEARDRFGFANGGKVPGTADLTSALRKMSKQDLRAFLGAKSDSQSPPKPESAPLSSFAAEQLIQSLHYPYNDMPSVEQSLKQHGYIKFPKQVAGGFTNLNPTWQREDVGEQVRFHPPGKKAATPPPLPPPKPLAPPKPAEVVPPAVAASQPATPPSLPAQLDKYQGPRSLWETMSLAGAEKTPERDSPFVDRLTESLTKYLPKSATPEPKLSDVVTAMRTEAADGGGRTVTKSPRGKSLWNVAKGKTKGFAGGGHVGSSSPSSLRPPAPEDTVAAMLKPGEVVLNEKQQQKLGHAVGAEPSKVFQSIGVPGFAGGGKVPAGGDGASAEQPRGFSFGGIVDKLKGGAQRTQQAADDLQSNRGRDGSVGAYGWFSAGKSMLGFDKSGLADELARTVKALRDFKDTTIDVNRNFSQFNTKTAAAYIELDLGRLQRDIRMADATGESGSKLTKSQNKLEWEQLGGRKLSTEFSNEGSRAIVQAERFLQMGTDIISKLLLLDRIAKATGKAVDWLEEIADEVEKFLPEWARDRKEQKEKVEFPGLMSGMAGLMNWNQQQFRDRVMGGGQKPVPPNGGPPGF